MGLRCLFLKHSYCIASFFKKKMVLIMCEHCPKVLITLKLDVATQQIHWVWGEIPEKMKDRVDPDLEVPIYDENFLDVFNEVEQNGLPKVWTRKDKDR